MTFKNALVCACACNITCYVCWIQPQTSSHVRDNMKPSTFAAPTMWWDKNMNSATRSILANITHATGSFHVKRRNTQWVNHCQKWCWLYTIWPIITIVPLLIATIALPCDGCQFTAPYTRMLCYWAHYKEVALGSELQHLIWIELQTLAWIPEPQLFKERVYTESAMSSFFGLHSIVCSVLFEFRATAFWQVHTEQRWLWGMVNNGNVYQAIHHTCPTTSFKLCSLAYSL